MKSFTYVVLGIKIGKKGVWSSFPKEFLENIKRYLTFPDFIYAENKNILKKY